MIKRRIHHEEMLMRLAIMLVLSGLFLAFFMPAVAGAADTSKSTAKNDAQRLIGRWVRPDGGYILELKEIGKDGKLKAAYFNPKSIKVARAELHRKEGRLTLDVELRDVNYPGSTYHLQYDPKTDRLIGTYFQAVYGETYEIEFTRAR